MRGRRRIRCHRKIRCGQNGRDTVGVPDCRDIKLYDLSACRLRQAKGQVQAARRRRDVVEIGRPARNVESRRFVGEFELPAHGATSSTRDSPEESSRKQRRSMCRAAVMR